MENCRPAYLTCFLLEPSMLFQSPNQAHLHERGPRLEFFFDLVERPYLELQITDFEVFKSVLNGRQMQKEAGRVLGRSEWPGLTF